MLQQQKKRMKINRNYGQKSEQKKPTCIHEHTNEWRI